MLLNVIRFTSVKPLASSEAVVMALNAFLVWKESGVTSDLGKLNRVQDSAVETRNVELVGAILENGQVLAVFELTGLQRQPLTPEMFWAYA